MIKANRPLRFIALTLGLLAVISIAACAPAAPATGSPTLPATGTGIPTQTPVEAPVTATQPEVPTDAPTAVPEPAATSRGPALEATDPTTVSLASGGLQLVEFFRFT